MPNSKSVGIAYSDPELTPGTTITGAVIDSTTRVLSNIAPGASAEQQGATVTTTGNSDIYFIAPLNGTLTAVDFSGGDALAANDTNFLTFTLTNLGQAGAGSTAMLGTNTTQATGGAALVANGRRALTLSGTAANLSVNTGDRLRFRAAATGTLPNPVTFPVVSLLFSPR